MIRTSLFHAAKEFLAAIHFSVIVLALTAVIELLYQYYR